MKSGKYLIVHHHYIQLENEANKVKEYITKNMSQIDDIEVFAVKNDKIKRMNIKLKIEKLH